jgi:DNA-binding IclR family transcriptional regulator
VTVCDPAGTPLGAIALVVPSNRFDRAAAARWAPVLFEAVRNVEEALARV